MNTFTDLKGRKWDVSINIANVALVEKNTGVSLYLILDDKAQPLQELLENLPLFATVVYWLCKRQADAQGIDDYDFAEAIAGDCLLEMRDALIEALVDFFPDARRRALLARMMTSGKRVEQMAMERMEKTANGMNWEAMESAALTSLLNESSGSTPEPSESTPAN